MPDNDCGSAPVTDTVAGPRAHELSDGPAKLTEGVCESMFTVAVAGDDTFPALSVAVQEASVVPCWLTVIV
ncbi:MAG: hypothetical protein ABSG43_01015 [Solirubrobacteraceae bacterium]